MQQDPEGEGANWYAYVDDNPLTDTDPEGLGEGWETFKGMFSRGNWEGGVSSGIASGYYGCVVEHLTGLPTRAHAAVHAYERGHGPELTARAYYHFTDKRFKAWGKYSTKLVPRLAAKIAPWAEAASGVGLVATAGEAFKAIADCSQCITGASSGR